MSEAIEPTYFSEPVEPDADKYVMQGANIIVLTQDNRICLQRRDEGIWSFPGALSFWGGGIEAGESFAETAARELSEELGAKVVARELVFIGAIERFDARRNGFTLGARFFWHDAKGTLGLCTEGKPEYYTSAALALADPRLHPGTHWALQECVRRGLIPA